MLEVAYRYLLPQDTPFIFNSWLKSFRVHSKWAREVAPEVYYASHKKVVADFLAKSVGLIACNPDCANQILAYGIYQTPIRGVTVLHYIYTKQPYRKMGLATDLFQRLLASAKHDPKLPVVATHIPDREFIDGRRIYPSIWEVLSPKWNLVFYPAALDGDCFYAQDRQTKAS